MVRKKYMCPITIPRIMLTQLQGEGGGGERREGEEGRERGGKEGGRGGRGRGGREEREGKYTCPINHAHPATEGRGKGGRP